MLSTVCRQRRASKLGRRAADSATNLREAADFKSLDPGGGRRTFKFIMQRPSPVPLRLRFSARDRDLTAAHIPDPRALDLDFNTAEKSAILPASDTIWISCPGCIDQPLARNCDVCHLRACKVGYVGLSQRQRPHVLF